MRGPALVAALAGLLFVAGAAPGLTWLDAGELGAAAWELGIAHPPGFPAFLLVHKLVMLLLPVGDVALRGNLASGLVGAAALALLFATGRRLGLSPWALGLGLLAAACAPAFALHAVTIEVYTGLGLFTAAGLFLLTRADDPRALVGLGLLAGLALGHHAELRLLLLPTLVLAWRAARWSKRALVLSAVAGLVGALVVLYLPLRSAVEPWRDWGDPQTPGAVWDHLMATRIRAAYGARMGQFEPADAAHYASAVLQPLGPALLLALPGLVLLARRPAGQALAAVLLLDATYAVALNPMGLRDLQNGLASVLVVSLGFAAALTWLLHPPPRFALAGRAGAAGACLLVVWTATPFSRAEDRGLPRVLDAATDETPPAGTALVISDNLAAGLSFAQVAEGARPDVAVLVRQHLWDVSAVEPVRRRLPGHFEAWRAGDPVATLPALRDPARRPGLRWQIAPDADSEGQPDGLQPGFPLFGPTAAPEGAARADRLIAELRASGGWDDPQARATLTRARADRADWLATHGREADAVAAYAQAASDAPELTAFVQARHAASLARLGRFDAAAELAAQAAAQAPDEPSHRLALARYTINAGRGELVRPLLDELVSENAETAEALGLRGLVRAQSGDLDGARSDFEAALKLDPRQPEAAYGIEKLRGRP